MPIGPSMARSDLGQKLK